MTQPLQVKQGASLDFTVEIQDDDGAPLDLSGATVTSQVRTAADVLVATLSPEMTATAGLVSVSVADTSTWPIGLLRCDVRVVAAGRTVFSETFGIQVGRAVTQ